MTLTSTSAPPPSSGSSVPADVVRFLSRITGDEKHSPSAHSTLDVLWVLYDRILRIYADDPGHPDRDRFLLSKGHGPAAYYAVLAAKGIIAPETLDTFATFDSPLGQHPDRALIPGVEISSGSLGHGLPIAVGSALALRALGNHARVIVLVGDGELDEGSNHEAIAVAGRLGLDRLTAIVIDNDSSSLGWPGGIAQRFAVEGWDTAVTSGRDHAAIGAALRPTGHGAPRAVVMEVEAK